MEPSGQQENNSISDGPSDEHSGSHAAFQRLPEEINIEIAAYLNDRDLISFAQVCKKTRAVIANESPLWRDLFAARFDLTFVASNQDLQWRYQFRVETLRKTRDLWKAQPRNFLAVLGVLGSLIKESYGTGRTVSNNISTIEQYCRDSNIIFINPASPTFIYLAAKQPILTALWVALSHTRFDPKNPTHAWAFDVSQEWVYRRPHLEPIFRGKHKTEVNFDYLLHCVNFFKSHITDPGAALAPAYSVLAEDSETIGSWKRSPQANTATFLRKYWRGVRASLDLDELESVRWQNHSQDTALVNNIFDVSAEIPPMILHHAINHEIPWPAFFEQTVKMKTHESLLAMTKEAALQAGKLPHKSRLDLPVIVNGYDDDGFFFGVGGTSALPSQLGISGWQRFTLVEFQQRSRDRSLIIDEGGVIPCLSQALREDAVCTAAFEGVVFPGGNIIAGRQWDPFSGDGLGNQAPDDGDFLFTPNSGPFMWWNTN